MTVCNWEKKEDALGQCAHGLWTRPVLAAGRRITHVCAGKAKARHGLPTKNGKQKETEKQKEKKAAPAKGTRRLPDGRHLAMSDCAPLHCPQRAIPTHTHQRTSVIPLLYFHALSSVMSFSHTSPRRRRRVFRRDDPIDWALARPAGAPCSAPCLAQSDRRTTVRRAGPRRRISRVHPAARALLAS